MNETEIQKRILGMTTDLERLQRQIITTSQDQPGYYHANEAFLNFSPEIRKAVLARVGRRIKLSAGISTLPTLNEFLVQAQKGLHTPDYYLNYSAPQGTYLAQEALRRSESAALTSTDELVYPPESIFLTMGGTGAVNLAFECIKQMFPPGRVLVLGLAYYVFQFTAHKLDMACDILLNDPIQVSHRSRFLPTPMEVRKSITDDIKLFVIAQPANPTGECYTREEVEALIDLANEKDIFILSDTVFADLVYSREDFVSLEEVAFAKGSLERILTIRSYSKNYNLPGLRIGYLATANPSIAKRLSFINERIQCCPPTIYTDLINFISLLRHIDIEMKRFPGTPLREVVRRLSHRYEIGKGVHAGEDLEKIYHDYCNFMDGNLSFYAQNFDRALETLGENVEAHFEKKAAFNTLIKVNHMPADINLFDFSVNLYLTTGIETQVGPCFGLGQRTWEKHLGFWLRLTHTLPPDELEQALRTFLVFRDIYVETPHRFLRMGLVF